MAAAAEAAAEAAPAAADAAATAVPAEAADADDACKLKGSPLGRCWKALNSREGVHVTCARSNSRCKLILS